MTANSNKSQGDESDGKSKLDSMARKKIGDGKRQDSAKGELPPGNHSKGPANGKSPIPDD